MWTWYISTYLGTAYVVARLVTYCHCQRVFRVWGDMDIGPTLTLVSADCRCAALSACCCWRTRPGFLGSRPEVTHEFLEFPFTFQEICSPLPATSRQPPTTLTTHTARSRVHPTSFAEERTTNCLLINILLDRRPPAQSTFLPRLSHLAPVAYAAFPTFSPSHTVADYNRSCLSIWRNTLCSMARTIAIR